MNSIFNNFDTVISIIENARSRALRTVNAELINMYRNVGEYLSILCAESSFGDKIIDEVAVYISNNAPTLKGFNRRGLYRMKQFYETYKDDAVVEYALSRSMSPMPVSDYTLCLPDKNILKNKLK